MADMEVDLDYDISDRDGRVPVEWDPVPPGGLPYQGQPMDDVPLLQQYRPLEAPREYERSAPTKTFEELEMSGMGGELMGRLSRHKVYLLEESGALIHRSADEGVRMMVT